MTWAHYQQLKQAAQQLISERRAALQPQGGEGVTINGNAIALTPIPFIEQEPPPDLWEVVILAQVTGRTATPGFPDVDFFFPWEMATRSYRDGIERGTFFWQKTNFFYVVDGGPGVMRSFTLELKVRTVTGDLLSPISDERMEELIYRIPVKLVLEEYEEVYRAGISGPVFVENRVIKTHEIELRRPVESRVFTPSKLGIFYLRPVALLRIE